MSDETNDLQKAPQPPLFTLDLGANGGIFSPNDGAELSAWLQREQQFWAWLPGIQNFGNHKNAVDQSLSPLLQAASQLREILPIEADRPNFVQRAVAIQMLLRQTFIEKNFPHSSTPLAHRVEQIRLRDPVEAVAYLFVYLPPSGYQFDARDNASWRGFIEGITERFDVGSVPHAQFEAALASMQQSQRQADLGLTNNRNALGVLQRHYEALSSDVSGMASEQKAAFENFIDANQKGHDEAMSQHGTAMATLEKTFRETMALRAPVEYWKGRKEKHERRAAVTGRAVFISMAALVVILGVIAAWVLTNLNLEGKPDAWRLALVTVVGVIGVWAVRLIVRMFLSHTHLATDAAERETMVMTYLALLEAEKLPTDDDRKLILQALFRPASDGYVKDEGLPHLALDFLTKSAK